jgi:hypothetical protein
VFTPFSRVFEIFSGGVTSPLALLLSLTAIGLSFKSSASSSLANVASESGSGIETITAKKVTIVDEAGHKRIEMVGSSIELFDAKGGRCASVTVSNDGDSNRFAIWRKDQRPLVSFSGSSSSGNAKILISDPGREWVSLDKNGLALCRNEVRTIELIQEHDYPQLVIRDKKGVRRGVLGFQDDDGAIKQKLPFLFLFDSHNRLRMSVGGVVATKEAMPKSDSMGGSILLFDSDRHPIWHAP